MSRHWLEIELILYINYTGNDNFPKKLKSKTNWKKFSHINICLKSSHELSGVHKDLSSLSIDYIVLEKNYCYSSSGKCRFDDIWKVEDFRLGRNDYSQDMPLICDQLFIDPKPLFKRVFANNYYHVLQLIKWTTLKIKSLNFYRKFLSTFGSTLM
jgi:hypothetical protein